MAVALFAPISTYCGNLAHMSALAESLATDRCFDWVMNGERPLLYESWLPAAGSSFLACATCDHLELSGPARLPAYEYSVRVSWLGADAQPIIGVTPRWYPLVNEALAVFPRASGRSGYMWLIKIDRDRPQLTITLYITALPRRWLSMCVSIKACENMRIT